MLEEEKEILDLTKEKVGAERRAEGLPQTASPPPTAKHPRRKKREAIERKQAGKRIFLSERLRAFFARARVKKLGFFRLEIEGVEKALVYR